jgi:hypothetical protein
LGTSTSNWACLRLGSLVIGFDDGGGGKDARGQERLLEWLIASKETEQRRERKREGEKEREKKNGDCASHR